MRIDCRNAAYSLGLWALLASAAGAVAAVELAAPRYMPVFGALAGTPLSPSGDQHVDEVLAGLKDSPPANALEARRLEPLAARLEVDRFDLRDALAPVDGTGPAHLTKGALDSLRVSLGRVLERVAAEKAEVLAEVRISRGDWKSGVAFARLRNFILARTPFLTAHELDELHVVEQRTNAELEDGARSRAHLLAVTYFMADLFAPEIAARDDSAIASVEYLFNRAQRQEDARRAKRSRLAQPVAP